MKEKERLRARVYWTDTQMRFTVVDNGREYDMYKSPITIASPALNEPFYLLHVWQWKYNPSGRFVDWNPRVVCR